MVMSWIWTGLIALSLISALITGQGNQLASAAMEGAQDGITLSISMAGALCLWSGIGNLMTHAGIMEMLSKLFSPLLHKLFPDTKTDAMLSGYMSANMAANFLGLGNAATPMGIQAAKRLAQGSNGIANDQLCRLIVLNTASIQLIPTNVAAIRSGLGCSTPFDILPAVWITSLCSVAVGLFMAWLLGRLHKK